MGPVAPHTGGGGGWLLVAPWPAGAVACQRVGLQACSLPGARVCLLACSLALGLARLRAAVAGWLAGARVCCRAPYTGAPVRWRAHLLARSRADAPACWRAGLLARRPPNSKVVSALVW